jgi:hypothetical protein
MYGRKCIGRRSNRQVRANRAERAAWGRRNPSRSRIKSSRRATKPESDVVLCGRRSRRRESHTSSRGACARAGRAGTKDTRAARGCRRRDISKAGPAFAARRCDAAPLHTRSVERSYAWECARRPGTVQALCVSRPARRGRNGRRPRHAPPHIGRRRAHIGLFETAIRRPNADASRLVLFRPRVSAGLCVRGRVPRGGEPTRSF